MVRSIVTRTLLGAAIIFIAAGCGLYTFSPAGKSGIKTIAVDRFENSTAEYGLADRMMDMVIDAFISDGNLKVVSAEKADAVLSGVLTSYSRKPYTYDQADQVQEYQVNMNFDIALKNPKDQSEIWKERMNQSGIYDVRTETEEQGQNRAIGFLVQSIINKTTRNW
jgi:outer membrane lipopolysaccharide assembly protein LptE/RlpB